MDWTQTSGTKEIRSTDGRWIIKPVGRKYQLFRADGYTNHRPQATIALCKQQAR